MTDHETIHRYFARFDEMFFQYCDKELLTINTFFSGELNFRIDPPHQCMPLVAAYYDIFKNERLKKIIYSLVNSLVNRSEPEFFIKVIVH